MAELLDKVEEGLVGVEEELLTEFNRIRKMESDEPYSKIDQFLKNKLEQIMQGLKHDLDHSGDINNLTLRTERHEQLYARIYVTTNLLDKPVPTAFIDMSHKEVLQSRREHQKEENKGPVQVYLDGGIYSASRELAVLNEVVDQHHKEGQSVEEIIQGRAQFLSKDLTNAPVQAKEGKPKVAQSVDEIRRKLEGKASSAGPSAFAARDVNSITEKVPDKPAPGKVAQSPEEIRRKLQERGAAASKGPSAFEAKDLSSSTPPPPPPPKLEKAKPSGGVAQTPEEIRRKLAERQASEAPSGKAVFGAKDIEPVAPASPAKEKKEEESKPAGKAVFESKDLSDKPPGS